LKKTGGKAGDEALIAFLLRQFLLVDIPMRAEYRTQEDMAHGKSDQFIRNL
jgi:hypothetical protein